MNAKTLKLLIVVAILAALLAWWLSGGDVRRGIPAEVGQAVAPGLAERLERLKTFRLSGKEPLVTIERAGDDGVFVVRERHSYPADVGKLRSYLLRLSESRLLEAKTANPERFAELGLGDPAAEGASSTLLELVFSDGEFSLLIGRYNGQGTGTFVRRPGQNQSWLASGDLTVERDAMRWIARELIDLPSGKISHLELLRPDGETIRATKAKEEEANFTVENLPPGRELSGEWAPAALAGLLSSLQVEDVQPAAEHPVPADALTLTYQTFDQRRYTMRLWKKEDAHFLAISAELLPAPAPAADDRPTQGAADAADEEKPKTAVAEKAATEEKAEARPPASVEAGASASTVAASRESLEREVERFNALVTGWVYRIPAWKYSAVDKRMEDLLKPKEG